MGIKKAKDNRDIYLWFKISCHKASSRNNSRVQNNAQINRDKCRANISYARRQ